MQMTFRGILTVAIVLLLLRRPEGKLGSLKGDLILVVV
jgi:hypothetical protein